ncbi:protein YqfG, partial [Vibrio parahaemolyticus]
LLLFTLSIPVNSDCVAMAIESRFKYMMLLF